MHRIGSRRRAARCLASLALSGTAACGLARAAAAQAADARVTARAGIDVFSAHASAAAPSTSGGSLQLGTAHVFSGSGLVDAFVRARRTWDRAGIALGWEQRTSPVHRAHALGVVVQARTRRGHLGVGVQMRRREFVRYAAHVRMQPHFGLSLKRHDAVLVLRAQPTDDALHIDLGARIEIHRHATIDVQHERVPGLAARSRAALTLHADGLVAHAAYDVATGSVASGLEVGSRSVHVVYGARTHPELGWSHAWMLEFGSRSRH